MTTPLQGIGWNGPGVDDATAAMIARNRQADSSSGTAGSDAWLITNADEDSLAFSSVTYDTNYNVQTASVIWPDGTNGVWTTLTASSLGVLSYQVTYLGVTTKTMTITITRNVNGQATNVTRSIS